MKNILRIASIAAFALSLSSLASAQTVTGQDTCTNTDCTVASLNVTGATIPVNGFYLSTTNTIGLSTNTSARFAFASNGMSSTGAAGARIEVANASATQPTFMPNKASATTGIGADASGDVSVINAGVENVRFTAAGLKFVGTAPTITGTGSPVCASTGTGCTNSAGDVTPGTGATSVVITFAGTFGTGIPTCVVSGHTQLAAFSYVVSATAITVTQTASTADISYICHPH